MACLDEGLVCPVCGPSPEDAPTQGAASGPQEVGLAAHVYAVAWPTSGGPTPLWLSLGEAQGAYPGRADVTGQGASPLWLYRL